MGVCKHCKKPTFKDPAGKTQHEQRAKPTEYTGRRTAPKPEGDGKPPEEREPDREHVLSRKLWGGGDKKPAAKDTGAAGGKSAKKGDK